jgi:tRNA(Ile)-lysidine synthase TilS/MesJ
MSLTLIDRLGKTTILRHINNETVRDLLIRNHIPPTSVLTMEGDRIVPDYEIIDSEKSYESKLIEGYDIGNIISVFPNTPKNTNGIYQKRRVYFNKDGSLISDNVSLTIEETADLVVNAVVDTIQHFGLIKESDRVLIGLSGGVDSSSLLLALHEAMEHTPNFNIISATFEDFDSRSSPTYRHAKQLADEFGIEHFIVPAQLIEDAFSLNAPLRDILPSLMKTDLAPMAMYIDHHTTRRALEIFAQNNNINKISIGLHCTDLMAGLLNGMASGYTVSSLPMRRIGNIEYIYPLAFIQKKELHIYHYARTGELARHSYPNAWERNPLDRNFYYFVADMLQETWPGIENYVFSAHNWRLRRSAPVLQETCSNCGSTLLTQPFMPVTSDECEACIILKKAGFRK